MPRFFFDFHGDGEHTIDQEGCEFASFELACVDAFQTMVRMGAEQLLEQRDPSAQWIDIRDSSRNLLQTLPFDEVFCRRRTIARAATSPARRSVQYQALREDISQACENARESVAKARETIARVNQARTAMHLGW